VCQWRNRRPDIPERKVTPNRSFKLFHA
jgi:hypothetical protein